MALGTLFMVGTPIGNLGDISERALEVLGSVGAIGCEDTRRSGLLLNRFGIKNPGLIIVNAHTERQGAQRIVELLVSGQDVALITDAGMPAISDPGALVVAGAVEAGATVTVVPGPCAVSAAVALCGFTGDGRYVFEGFLPRKKSEREQRLAALAGESRQIVLYEAPHRLHETLSDLCLHLGAERRCCIARELTKLHESVWRGPLGEAVASEPKVRGEYVLVVEEHTAADVEVSDESIRQSLEDEISAGVSKRDAIRIVSKNLNQPRNRVYAIATSL